MQRISPRGGAKPLQLQRPTTGFAVGFNRFGVIDAMDAAYPFRGPLLLASDPGGVYATSLLVEHAAALFRPQGDEEVIANNASEESISYRGLAANSEMFCFLTGRPGSGQARLRIRYFYPERAGEDARTIAGSEFLAPVISGDSVGVCSNEEVVICNLRLQSYSTFPIPRNFRPFFRRPYQANIPPGGLPFSISQSDEGHLAFVAGLQDDRPGILRLRIDRHFATFEGFTGRACISNALPEGLTVNRGDSADFLAVQRPSIRVGDLEMGMPIGYTLPQLAWFNRPEVEGMHRISIFSGMPSELALDDPDCNEDSCCSPSFCDGQFVVSYFYRNGSGRGIRIAHSDLTGH